MIPHANIIAWSNVAPWAALRQVEQDLIISRAVIDIFNDDYLREELRFRDGTALILKVICLLPFNNEPSVQYERGFENPSPLALVSDVDDAQYRTAMYYTVGCHFLYLRSGKRKSRFAAGYPNTIVPETLQTFSRAFTRNWQRHELLCCLLDH